jgi:hypothetical protein
MKASASGGMAYRRSVEMKMASAAASMKALAAWRNVAESGI